MKRDIAERWLWGKHLEEINFLGSKGSVCNPEGPQGTPQSKQTILLMSHCGFFFSKCPHVLQDLKEKGWSKARMKIKEGNKNHFRNLTRWIKEISTWSQSFILPTILNIAPLMLPQSKFKYNTLFLKTQELSGAKKDAVAKHKRETNLFFTVTRENWQRKVKPSTVSQTLASGILLRKKKVTYESVQPCFVLHECFNRASVI